MDITILISFDGSSTSRHTICKLKASPDIVFRLSPFSSCYLCVSWFFLFDGIRWKCPGSTDDLDRIDT